MVSYFPTKTLRIYSSVTEPEPTKLVLPFSLTFNCPNAEFSLGDVLTCLQRAGKCPTGALTLCDYEHLGGSSVANKVTITGSTEGIVQ